MSDPVVFEDSFTITSLNDQKYDRVARITATSGTGDTQITLDVNTELYPLHVNELVHLVLATTLNHDGRKDERGWRDLSRTDETTLADLYDYVCRGKIYRFEEANGAESLQVFVSFGGLLLFMEGPFKKLTGLRMEYVYLLMKK